MVEQFQVDTANIPKNNKLIGAPINEKDIVEIRILKIEQYDIKFSQC